MRIQLGSDYHLEFAPITLENKGSDLLILSGDIINANRSEIDKNKWRFDDRFMEFFEDVSKKWDEVIYIAGNHEFYGGNIDTTFDFTRNKLKEFKNIHLLEKETFSYQGVIFLGTTLWSDFNKEDPTTLYSVQHGLNDYRLIGINGPDGFYSGHTIIADDILKRHNENVSWIKKTLIELDDAPTVIAGHHAPSKKSTHPRYKEDFYINGGYSSDLEYIMKNYKNILLWTHGHTHDSFDYKIGETRVVANPRGYAFDNSRPEVCENVKFNPSLIIEI